MSKSVKYKNFIDSDSINYNRATLKQILEQNSVKLNINDEYVYPTDLSYFCVRIGKIVFLNIRTIAFKKEIANYVNLISGLPVPESYVIFWLQGNGNSARFGLTGNGEIRTHWGSPSEYGNTSNKQYSGLLIYKAK